MEQLAPPCTHVPTTSPQQVAFKILVSYWPELNKGSYSLIKLSGNQRELISLVEKAKVFLEDWLVNNSLTYLFRIDTTGSHFSWWNSAILYESNHL